MNASSSRLPSSSGRAPTRRRLQVLGGSRLARRLAPPPPPPWWGRGELPPLQDAFGRRIAYLRVSVTDRCDLRCGYCMPQGGEHEHGRRRDLLSFEEVERLAAVLAPRGVRRVRITGGEPLVRRGLAGLVERLAALPGIEEVTLTTNATQLARHVEALARAGLRSVNVSLDSLRPERFARITGGALQPVLEGLQTARRAGLRLKTNTVLLRGLNDDELEDIVRFAWSLGATPRFIELMPLGAGAAWMAEHHLPVAEARERLRPLLGEAEAQREPGRGPAHYLPAADGSGRRVGFIGAASESFCEGCNRMRISAQGDVRPCLADRRAVNLREPLRAGAGDAELRWLVHWALGGKAEGHRFADPHEHEHERVGMSLIGG